MNTFELIVLGLALLFVIVLLSSVAYCSYSESKLSNRLREPKNYPPCTIQVRHATFHNGRWDIIMIHGTPEEIIKQKEEWDEISKKNLEQYEKSARLRNVIALRKKLKERHCEQYCK